MFDYSHLHIYGSIIFSTTYLIHENENFFFKNFYFTTAHIFKKKMFLLLEKSSLNNVNNIKLTILLRQIIDSD